MYQFLSSKIFGVLSSKIFGVFEIFILIKSNKILTMSAIKLIK